MSLRLEDLRRDALVKGLLGRERVPLVSAQRMHGATLQVVFHSSEVDLELVAGCRKGNFEVEGAQHGLMAEAERFRRTWLADTYVAISSSTIDLRLEGTKGNLKALNAWVGSCTLASAFERNANTHEHRILAVCDGQEYQHKMIAFLGHCHTHSLDHLPLGSGRWTGEKR
jgi:hypothetical protein